MKVRTFQLSIIGLVCVAVAAGVWVLSGGGYQAAKKHPEVARIKAKLLEEAKKEKAEKESVKSTPMEDTKSAQAQQEELTKDLKLMQFENPKRGDTIATIKTSMGDIKIRLFPKQAPKACENFISLAEKDYYKGVIFHRVINNFMIQTGDPEGTGMGGESKWGKPFEDEFSSDLHNFRGAVSMANSGPGTNGSQFFIVQANGPAEADSAESSEVKEAYKKLGGTPWLDNKHTVFGQVIEGLDVVDKIAGVEVGAADKPTTAITITEIETSKYGEKAVAEKKEKKGTATEKKSETKSKAKKKEGAGNGSA
ncbi:MAG: peptidylprolyl isomerase [Oscillospiraceae bacterium]|jgi:peptidyl-prolyl cis-trans isomerase B (cyclophilin B)|nr:peptidylprolyl isomerase [Oscillospiraceae bacterium]